MISHNDFDGPCGPKGDTGDFDIQPMIGVFHTAHPTQGYSISVRFRRVDRNITILGIHSNGKDVWGSLSSAEIQEIKSRIPVS
jgi:hypothetical protein